MEAQGLLRARRSKRNSDPARLTDNRARVVNEILETERTYVQDLENLQAYMRALQSDGAVVSPETIHLIFANINALVDFQRRFLIAVETNAALPPLEQNFGQVFSQHEEAFAVYEPFCSNVKTASALVVQESDKLQVSIIDSEPDFSGFIRVYQGL
jgi:cell division control protein 24